MEEGTEMRPEIESNRGAAADEWRYAEKAMTWYGWGSPVGVGIFLLCVAGAAALVRFGVMAF
jgi:hypothetical protein